MEETTAKKKPAGSRAVRLLGASSNFVVTGILLYAAVVANQFRGILYPKFPDIDPNTHNFLRKYGNVIRTGDNLSARVWVGTTAWPTKKEPLATFEFVYDWDTFKPFSRKINASITQEQLKKGKQMVLSVEVKHSKSGKLVKGKGDLVKKMKRPEVRPSRSLINGSLCPVEEEPTFGKKVNIGRGIPSMEVRLVYDTTAYPPPWAREEYAPRLFVDEFWMTPDRLVKLNKSGDNVFESEVHFNLMSAPRWRFQHHMEAAMAGNAKIFGEDSEEQLQMRDLFANTNPYLLVVTLIVSVLHMIFEFLAFKNDVQFWQGCDPAMLNKYMSVQSIVVGIFMQIVLLMYLWDESANFLVLITSLVGIFIDVWKVQRAMQLRLVWISGVIPMIVLESKVKLEKKDDFDSVAMKWLTVILSPGIIGYAIYTLVVDCHRGWYSYFLSVSASCVYSLGFILMTPQVFINYKHKTVAYLPWRKFIYRALCTFIDDLFALIIRMPTMHRLSCFRDDIVFFIYLYQRHLYPVDKSRSFDDEGYEIPVQDDGAASNESELSEAKKDR